VQDVGVVRVLVWSGDSQCVGEGEVPYSLRGLRYRRPYLVVVMVREQAVSMLSIVDGERRVKRGTLHQAAARCLGPRLRHPSWESQLSPCPTLAVVVHVKSLRSVCHSSLLMHPLAHCPVTPVCRLHPSNRSLQGCSFHLYLILVHLMKPT
jgi:hypothetical protein